MAPKKPRTKNNLELFIFNASKPIDLIIGSIIIKASRFRKKTTSNICKFSAAFLIKITIIEKKTIDSKFRIIALV